MRKSLWIFLLAVLVPSAVLGWLALRSAEEQKIILERRTLELYQHETQAVAAAARTVIDEQRRAFSDIVQRLLAQRAPGDLATKFTEELSKAWNLKAVGFTIGDDGRMLCPSPRAAVSKPDWQRFLWDQGSFLGGDIAATVYNVPVDQANWAMNRKAVGNDYSSISEGKGRGYANQRPSQSAQQVQELTPEKSQEKIDVFALKKMAPSETPNEKEVLEMKLKFNRPSTATPAVAGTPEKTSAPGATPATDPAHEPTSRRMAPAAPKAAATRTTPIEDGAALGTTKTKQVAQPEPSAPVPAPAPAPTGVPAPAPTVPKPTVDLAATTAPQPDARGLGDKQTLDNTQLAEVDRRRRMESNTQLRQVQPQQLFPQADQTAWSTLAPETTEFRLLCQGLDEGVITRFVQDKLTLIFWLRPAQAPNMIFGCTLDASDLRELWASVMPEPHRNLKGVPEFVLALLDDKVRPIATTPADAGQRDWKRPFVADEIGEALPHWEAALYLMRPEQLQESAIGLRRTLMFLIVAMLGAILLGGWLVVADARRQFALAQQKTDFVSNVSHELKTPLTSIRMFAELMLGGRPETQVKSPQYLRIIMVEAERLTRLINNVLDFAKLERRQKRFDKKPLDLHSMIERIWESHELHLRESGFSTKWRAASPPYPVIGDEDALAQILVNLLSNAEKYCGERKEIELHTYLDDHHVCIAVLDRGNGVPNGEERKIFEAFYRAHDSLSSGIQGSGLGLTLAQRLAQEHGGTIEYRAREGGGSAFTLRLPLSREPATACSEA